MPINLLPNRFSSKGIYISVFIAFCFTLLFSCKKDPEYQIDPALEPYLDRFLQEARLRGVNLDIKKDGILMEFADLTPPAIGLCYYTLPRRIQIDRSYWTEASKYPNAENLKEDVVFHELGHGFLGRRHDNSTLPDTEWLTMMCGGDEVDARSWSVNFNGYRKQYYLDELFGLNPEIPNWAQPAVFDGMAAYPNKLYGVDFTNQEPSSGMINSEAEYEIKDGLYTITSLSETNMLYSLYSGLVSGDFYLEINMQIFNAGGISGIFAGYYKSNSNESYNYFSIYTIEGAETSPHRVSAVNTTCDLPFAEVLLEDKYKENQINKFGLSKKGDEMFFYVNDRLVYRNDYKLTQYDQFGIIIPTQGSLSIRDFAFYSSSPNGVRSSGAPLINNNRLFNLKNTSKQNYSK